MFLEQLIDAIIQFVNTMETVLADVALFLPDWRSKMNKDACL